MGLLSKLKANFNHGGVKITVNGPPAVTVGDLAYAVDVTLVASDVAQSIKSITVSIIENRNQPINYNDPNHGTSNNQEFTLFQVSDNTAFSLQPGETKTVHIGLPLAAQPQQLPGGALGSVISALANGGQFTSHTYQLQAKADVDGIALDPTAHQSIQLIQ